MSIFKTPAAGKSGYFIREAAFSGSSIIRLENWDDSFVVPDTMNGAIIHAQMKGNFPLPLDTGKSWVARVKANGVLIAEFGSFAGNNNGGAVGAYGSCIGTVTGPATYNMSIDLVVVDDRGGGSTDNQFPSDDPDLPGPALVEATGDPDTPPVSGGRTLFFHHSHYIVQLY